MKTSNKLLLGLFAVIVVCMIIGNFVLKNEVKNNPTFENQFDIKSQTDSVSSDSTTFHINIK